MCGIAGYLDKGAGSAPIGTVLLGMLSALDRRGPDSAGVAAWSEPADDLIVRVAVGGETDAEKRIREIIRRARGLGRVGKITTQGPFLRLAIASADPQELVRVLELDRDVEVVSMGRGLEIVKQVGPPRNLDLQFGVSKLTGSHGIGHTRLSTESRVDLSHSQPFWAHGFPDLAVVHNGHITNYHRLRRIYEQDGVRFYTENDSEVIGVYLARKLRAGLTLREALRASVKELDGSFSYLAATSDTFGFAKDPYCLKPLIVAETSEAVAIANEEIALHAAFGEGYRAREAGAGEVATWDVRRGRATGASRRVRAIRKRRAA